MKKNNQSLLTFLYVYMSTSKIDLTIIFLSIEQNPNKNLS